MENEAAEKLRGWGVKGILVRIAEHEQLIDVRCEMPKCYCHHGRRHFEPVSSGSHWIPTADHYPRLRMHGGKLTPDNVRLGHKLCNNLDFQWRVKINPMLAKGMSLAEIAAELNGKNVRPIHGTNKWTPAAVRKAFVS